MASAYVLCHILLGYNFRYWNGVQQRKSDRRKYVKLIPEFSVNNDKDYGWLLDWRFTEYLLVFKYKKEVFKTLENLSGTINT